jgi:hypothetical protein
MWIDGEGAVIRGEVAAVGGVEIIYVVNGSGWE